jgi:hypothetical protein
MSKLWCERKLNYTKEHFDPRSFRWVKSGRARVLIGCPKGEWNARSKSCKVGTVGYKRLVPALQNGTCGRHNRRGQPVRKRS